MACQERHDLPGMSHDVFRLGIVGRFLVKRFDGWHVRALLGDLDAIADEKKLSILPREMIAEDIDSNLHPPFSEHLQIDRLTSKHPAQGIVTSPVEAKASDEARHTGKVCADGEGHERGEEPEEGSLAAKGRAETTGDEHPAIPEGPGGLLSVGECR